MSDWGGRISATATRADGVLLLHGGVSRRTRFPALRELYAGALGRFEPNPLLRPELLTAAEAGLTRHGADVELQAVAFHRVLSGAIERVTLANGRFQRVNRGELRSAGIELLGSAAFGPFAVAGDVTLQRVRLHLDGEAETDRPEYQPDLIAGLGVQAPLPLGLRAGATARHVGRQHCANPDAPGQHELGASTRLDADVGRELGLRAAGLPGRIELRAGVDNIADSAVYDQCGLPQPGRTLRVQLRMR
jgi:iron complex outermembrane recepter protein